MRIYPFLIAILVLSSCSASKKSKQGMKINEVYEMKEYFDECKVDGCFILYSPVHDMWVTYNEKRGKQGYLPASTFKILNSLIALETGVARDTGLVIPWDSTIRSVPEWNRSHSMRTAFRASAVPYYREIARRVGYKNMRKYVKAADYGDMDIRRTTLDSFWLGGESRITPFEQVNFLRRFYNYELPFDTGHIDMVKDMMLMDSTLRYILRGKTGWTQMRGKDIGWLTGILENQADGHIYFFATNIEAVDPDPQLFMKCRKQISMNIMREIGCL